jgi:hypothetical protein
VFEGDDRAVADVEVDVTRGEVVVVEFLPDRCGAIDHVDLQRSIVGVGRRVQDVEVAAGDVVVE